MGHAGQLYANTTGLYKPGLHTQTGATAALFRGKQMGRSYEAVAIWFDYITRAGCNLHGHGWGYSFAPIV